MMQLEGLAGAFTMNPVTHFLTGWVVANVDDLERRDRAIVTLAAVIPDVDGLGILMNIASKDQEMGLYLYGQYHHSSNADHVFVDTLRKRFGHLTSKR